MSENMIQQAVPSQESTVLNEVDRLRSEVNEIQDAIGQLHDSLDPILRKHTPPSDNTGAVKQVDGKSEAYYSLQSIIELLSSQKRRLYSIISNIDL